MSTKTIVVALNDASHTVASYKIAVRAAGTPSTHVPLHIKAVPNVRYQITDEATNLAPEHLTIKRADKNLQIFFKGNDSDQPDLVIENYYKGHGEPGYADGAGGAAFSGSGGGNTSPVEKDTDAPAAPTQVLTANPNGTLTVTGKAEPGSTVTVTYPDDTTGTATAGSDGSYTTTSDGPQTTGTVTATTKDEAGNTSKPTETKYVDTIAPSETVQITGITTDMFARKMWLLFAHTHQRWSSSVRTTTHCREGLRGR